MLALRCVVAWSLWADKQSYTGDQQCLGSTLLMRLQRLFEATPARFHNPEGLEADGSDIYRR